MGTDWRGDPRALLECWTPTELHLHGPYLDVEFDLSQVMFICTANTLDGIRPRCRTALRSSALRLHPTEAPDRQDVSLPKQLKDHGLGKTKSSDGAIDRAIEEYTREAGVRSLNREMASLARKSAMKIVSGEAVPLQVTADAVPAFLGTPKHLREKNSFNGVGVSTGLAWTEVGGCTMAIEVVAFPGKGELKLTGKLGSVMTESAHAALSYLKSISKELQIGPEQFKDVDYHIHVPEGATPRTVPRRASRSLPRWPA